LYGSDRFEILQKLGSGGYGTVYRARDRKSSVSVALKILHKIDPESLYSFKKEFRSVSGLTHPNLVTLYELMIDGGQCFFTMELVEGVGFTEFVRTGARNSSTHDSGATTLRFNLTDKNGSESSSQGGTLKVNRLRSALKQLAEGIHFIHQAGKL